MIRSTARTLPIHLDQVGHTLSARSSEAKQDAASASSKKSPEALLVANQVAATHTSSPGKPTSVVPSTTSPTVHSFSFCARTGGKWYGGPTSVASSASVLSNCQVKLTSCGPKREQDTAPLFVSLSTRHKIHQYAILRTASMCTVFVTTTRRQQEVSIERCSLG